MTNAFTAKPDVSWLKKEASKKKIAEKSTKRTQDLSSGHRQKLSRVVAKKGS